MYLKLEEWRKIKQILDPAAVVTESSL